MKKDAFFIIENSINDVLPGKGVIKALSGYEKKAYLLSIGKGAWEMANACSKCIGENLIEGIVITKYGHSKGEIDKCRIFEAGHPIPDENGIEATRQAVELAKRLMKDDNLIFLISGGGSALFELPEEGLSLKDLEDMTQQLLECGADITEINTIRKKLSMVKGGKFAKLCGGADIYSVILSDVLSNNPRTIASGPVSPDYTSYEDVCSIINKYDLNISDKINKYLKAEPPGEVSNVEIKVIGSVSLLCEAAAKAARELGYNSYIIANDISCEAASAGSFIASIAKYAKTGLSFQLPCALIFGGETVVKVTGKGKGGRNQEIALSAAKGIAGLEDILIFSVGSDGTDGPTDAAGGIVDGQTLDKLLNLGISVDMTLKDNNAYNALNSIGELIFTGQTGTNVNDVSVALIR